MDTAVTIQFAPMTTLAFCATLLAAHAQAGDLAVTAFNQVIDHSCHGTRVVVEAFNNALTVTGSCAALGLSGVQNNVDFEKMGTVFMEGANNRAAGTLAGAGPTTGPDVTLVGSDNVLVLRFDRPAVVEIAGSGNSLFWTTAPGIAPPQISILGVNNTAENQ